MPITLRVLIWSEIIVSFSILTFGVPVLVERLIITQAAFNDADLFLMVTSVTSFFYLTTGFATLIGHRFWRLLHYVVTAIACVLTGSLFLNIGIQIGTFHFYYYMPAVVSVILALIVLSFKEVKT